MRNLSKPINVGGINVGIVSGGRKAEYNTFDLRTPIMGVKLIGVSDGDQFEVAFQSTSGKKYGLAVYLDGVNVAQTNGLKNLSDILMEHDYDSHSTFIAGDTTLETLNRYSQKDGSNRVFTFSLDAAKSVNLNTIDDKTKLNRIDVFLWEEDYVKVEATKGLLNSRRYSDTISYTVGNDSLDRSYVGAGAATNESYNTGQGLRKAKYLGKAVFIHTPYNNLDHLGPKFVVVPELDKITADPMANVPYS